MGIFTSTYSLMHKPSLNLRSHNNLMFTPVHAHTNAYKYSFFPHCINLWNHLPPNIFDGDHTTTITSFRNALLAGGMLCNVLYFCMLHKHLIKKKKKEFMNN